MRQRAVMLGARDLEAQHGQVGFDLATVQLAAKSYPAGDKADERTIRSLRTPRCLLFRRKDGRLQLTESGRARLREGL